MPNREEIGEGEGDRICVVPASVDVQTTIFARDNIMAWLDERGYTYRPDFQVSDEIFKREKEIEQQIAKGGLSKSEELALWRNLYLTIPEIEDVLAFVDAHCKRPFMSSMLIREKKRVRGKETTRSVPRSPRLRRARQLWLKDAASRQTFHDYGTPLATVGVAISRRGVTGPRP